MPADLQLEARALGDAPEVVIAIHDGHCVRIDRARATIDRQGWEASPAYGSRM